MFRSVCLLAHAPVWQNLPSVSFVPPTKPPAHAVCPRSALSLAGVPAVLIVPTGGLGDLQLPLLARPSPPLPGQQSGKPGGKRLNHLLQGPF